MSKYSNQRKNIEKHIITQLVSRDDTRIYNIERGYNKRILSYSPRTAYEDTNMDFYHENHRYSGLSQAIHNEKDSERNKVEKQILQLVPNYYSRFFHLFLKEISNYKNYVLYCNEFNIPLLKKEQYNTLSKLIKKWKILSQNEHYSPTKQEKRKMKKMSKR